MSKTAQEKNEACNVNTLNDLKTKYYHLFLYYCHGVSPLCLSIVYFNVFHQAFSAYYKGGFEQKMTKREASLILGIR